MNSNHKFPYVWSLADGYPPKNGLKVMSTFCCGGGSSMGYKLAGYDVIAANDIDPIMREIYLANNKVDKFYLCPVKDLLNRDDLSEVDVLDGSPPCSTFSVAGEREKSWGKEKKFREGQAKQVLSDLFFDFIALAKKMNPPVVIAENVKGMLIGNAKGYTKMVVQEFQKIGYDVQVFLLNASTMGCPTDRERVFFIANRLGKKIKLEFNEAPIKYGEFASEDYRPFGEKTKRRALWNIRKPNDKDLSGASQRGFGENSFFNYKLVKKTMIVPTIVSADCLVRYDKPGGLSVKDLATAQTFPQDYNYCGKDAVYTIGMSVPPVMMAQVSSEVAKQFFNRR